MSTTPNSNNQIASIANKFIQHARYKLTPREQKLILYMATLIRSEDSDFKIYMVPVSEIEHILKGGSEKKHGSFYERLDDLLDSITDKKISFPTDFKIDNIRLRGYISWVAGAIPKLNDDGVLCVEFSFSPQLKPFLLGLREKFTQFEIMEVSTMTSGFSIRIFQMCKAFYYENIRHGRNTLHVGVEELKLRLGIAKSYKDWRNFRRKVLDVAKKEINAKTRLNIDYEYGRSGRKITQVRILINEKKNIEILPKMMESEKEENNRRKDMDTYKSQLSEAQLRAFGVLLDYGVNKVVIVKEFLPIIKGSELVGYEDFFVQRMLLFFEEKTDRKKQGAKVKALIGWVRNKRFEEPNLYARLSEEVIAKKKQLTDEEFSNREMAKKMTAKAFRQSFKKNKKEKPVDEVVILKDEKTITPKRKPKASSGFQSFGDLAAKVKGQQIKKRSLNKSPFAMEDFKKENSSVYEQIREERTAAFEPFKKSRSYKKQLENSIAAYCEKWYNEN